MSRERSIALSGVPERLRNLSEREFYNTAIERMAGLVDSEIKLLKGARKGGQLIGAR